MSRQVSQKKLHQFATRSLKKYGFPAEALHSVECDPYDGDDGGYSYWVYLRPHWVTQGGYGCHTIHEATLKQIDYAIADIAYKEDDEGGYQL